MQLFSFMEILKQIFNMCNRNCFISCLGFLFFFFLFFFSVFHVVRWVYDNSSFTNANLMSGPLLLVSMKESIDKREIWACSLVNGFEFWKYQLSLVGTMENFRKLQQWSCRNFRANGWNGKLNDYDERQYLWPSGWLYKLNVWD